MQATAPLAPAGTVLGEIERQTSDWRVRLAMVLGANLEGGNAGAGPWGVGDQGHSFGPFQINLPYHPGMTSTSATNPHDAVAYMLGSYQSAVSQVSSALWQSNPEKAAEQAAYIAERPAQDYYIARGASTVDQAYQTAVAEITGGKVLPSGNYQVLGGGANTTTPGSGGAATVFGIPGTPKLPGDPTQIFTDILNGTAGKAVTDAFLNGLKTIFKPVLNFLENSFLVIFGLAIIIIALVVLAHDNPDETEQPSEPSSSSKGKSEPAAAAAAAAAE